MAHRAIRRAIATLIGMAGLAMSALPAAATTFRPYGRDDGTPFLLQCGPGEAMIGVRANAGAWIDGLAILCAEPGSTRRRAVGWVGGRGGMDQEVYCMAGQRPAGIMMTVTRDARYLNGVGFNCADDTSPQAYFPCLTTGEGCLAEPHRLGTWHSGAMPHQCDGTELLVGLVGRADRYVHALGAVCDTLTRAAALPTHSTGPGEPGNAGDRSRVAQPSSSWSRGNERIGGSWGQSAASTGAGGMTGAMSSNAGAMDRCLSGFVWREAQPSDHVCVKPEVRDRTRLENDLAQQRRDPGSPYGPMGCLSGFVWREAFEGDLTCVTPEIRSLVRQDNAMARQRRR